MSYDSTVIITGNKIKLQQFYNDFKRNGSFSLSNILGEPFKYKKEDEKSKSKGVIIEKNILSEKILKHVYSKRERDIYNTMRKRAVNDVYRNNGLFPSNIKKDNPINYYLYINNRTGNIEFDIDSWRYINWGSNIDEGNNIYYEHVEDERIVLKSTTEKLYPIEFWVYCEKRYKGLKFRYFKDLDYGTSEIYEVVVNKKEKTTKKIIYNKMDYMINIMKVEKLEAYKMLYDDLLNELLQEHKYSKIELVNCKLFKTALEAAYEYNIDLVGTCSESLIKITQ